jgi:aspartate kinase
MDLHVFKFGGASVKDAGAVRNATAIIRQHARPGIGLAVVVSAMGKTTNALEAILQLAMRRGHQDRLRELYRYHEAIAAELELENAGELLASAFAELEGALRMADDESLPFGQRYDAAVGHGELLATRLLASFLAQEGLPVHWADARELVRTDSRWQEPAVDWPETRRLVGERLRPVLEAGRIAVVQGFIGADAQGRPTTLGREGSDFTAAILASCLGAQAATIWKDVPGVLNADPKRVPDTVLYERLPYREAAEMTYYGASVIHPKTIQPLANAGIPLHVRSFLHPEAPGTCIGDFPAESLQPAIIFKSNQSLVRFESKDLSNIGQRHLSRLIDACTEQQVAINFMMNTAVSFSVCMNTHPDKAKALREALGGQFEVLLEDHLELVTIKHPTEEAIARFYRPERARVSLRTAGSFQFVQEASLGGA